MEQSDDDISDEDSSDNDQLAVLPCDLQTWPAICSLLKELQLCRNISEIGRILADLDGIVNPSSDNDGTSKDNTIKFGDKIRTSTTTLVFYPQYHSGYPPLVPNTSASTIQEKRLI